jgi:hypothetical protein
MWKDHFDIDQMLNPNYCRERQSLIHAYHIILNDFYKLFDYIELHDGNKNTFSHRIYELLLRTCTEFENNCKGILKDNGYTKNSNFNIKDYFKISAASKLSEYEIKINVWSPSPRIYRPFADWDRAEFQTLTWYQNYNLVKHDRSNNFHLANLETLVQAVGGLFIIVASQFYTIAFHPYQTTFMNSRDDYNFLATQDSLLAIKFPQTWTNEDFCNQDVAQNTLEDPFRKYPF